MALWVAYTLTALIGAAAAVAELVSRYKDAPVRATLTISGVCYFVFNAAVAMVTFALIYRVFPVYADASGEPDPTMSELVTLVLLAGTASLAIMRSSLFTIRVGNQDVEIGLAGIIQIFRFAIDRNVDRVRAHDRAAQVAVVMKDVSFERAYRSLTSMCMSLMQNVAPEEKALVEQRVEALANRGDSSDEGKALELGLILAGTAGFDVLKAAKDNLRDGIATGTSRKETVIIALQKIEYGTTRDELPLTCLGLARELSEEDQLMITEQVARIDAGKVSDHAKAVNIGLLLAHIVGETVFTAAVDLLSTKGKKPATPTAPAQPPSGRSSTGSAS
ncbi:MAG: hypothetical protein AAGF94_16565 [Pseudomonadota bacterium]